MKGVTDIFISKEKLAIFWFLAACGCLAGTAWYLHDVALANRGSMLYVPVEKSFVYLDRSLKQQELDELVDYHTRLGLETYLNRGSNGPATPQRITLLFSEEGFEQVMKNVRENSYDFRTRQIHQILEVGQVQVQHFPDGSAFTIAEGQLVRVSVDPDSKESLIQSFLVSADMTWKRNPSLRDARRFPFICTAVNYTLRALSSSQ